MRNANNKHSTQRECVGKCVLKCVLLAFLIWQYTMRSTTRNVAFCQGQKPWQNAKSFGNWTFAKGFARSKIPSKSAHRKWIFQGFSSSQMNARALAPGKCAPDTGPGTTPGKLCLWKCRLFWSMQAFADCVSASHQSFSKLVRDFARG